MDNTRVVARWFHQESAILEKYNSWSNLQKLRYAGTDYMDVLKKLFEQHFHSSVIEVRPLQGQLGGSGRQIKQRADRGSGLPAGA